MKPSGESRSFLYEVEAGILRGVVKGILVGLAVGTTISLAHRRRDRCDLF